MSREILFILGALLVLIFLYLMFSGGKKKDRDYFSSTQSDKEFILFFAHWCGHCKNLMPIWDEFAKNFDGYKGVKIVKINSDENSEIVGKHRIAGFPTIKFCPYGRNVSDGIVYEGDRSLQDLASFLQRHA